MPDTLSEDEAMRIVQAKGVRYAYLSRAAAGGVSQLDLVKLLCAMSTELDDQQRRAEAEVQGVQAHANEYQCQVQTEETNYRVSLIRRHVEVLKPLYARDEAGRLAAWRGAEGL